MTEETNSTDRPAETLEYDHVRISFGSGLATLTLSDPNHRNAISPGMAEGIISALGEVTKPRRQVRALLLVAEGRAFCAGTNQADHRAQSQRGFNPVLPRAQTLFHPLIRKFRDVEVPIITAVNGPCVGIGVALVLLSDHVIASERAFFMLPFRNLAVTIDSGLSWMLPRAIGLARAREMMMRANRVPAETAAIWGLINEAVPENTFAARVEDIAREFAEGPTIALGLMRRLVLDSSVGSFDAQLEAESRAVGRCSRSADNVAAIRAFGSKTPIVFEGR